MASYSQQRIEFVGAIVFKLWYSGYPRAAIGRECHCDYFLRVNTRSPLASKQPPRHEIDYCLQVVAENQMLFSILHFILLYAAGTADDSLFVSRGSFIRTTSRSHSRRADLSSIVGDRVLLQLSQVIGPTSTHRSLINSRCLLYLRLHLHT